MMAAVGRRHRPEIAGTALVAAACFLAACGNSPAPRAAARTSTTTTTTTTTAPPPTTPVGQSVAVPDVLGMKIALARFYLRAAGFATVPLNAACNKGTLVSQSVVASLSVPGKPPDVRVGALPLVPGTTLTKGARVGITWSDCYPNGTAVPLVTGQTFARAVHLLHLAGLNWACFSVGSTTTTTHPHATTTRPSTTTTPSGPTTASTGAPATSTSAPPPTSTSPPKPPQTVLSQGTHAGTTVHAGSVVDLVMQHCPQ
jgi:beta-lactam-binding protein with PASTA domain